MPGERKTTDKQCSSRLVIVEEVGEQSRNK